MKLSERLIATYQCGYDPRYSISNGDLLAEVAALEAEVARASDNLRIAYNLSIRLPDPDAHEAATTIAELKKHLRAALSAPPASGEKEQK